ncbi:MAG: lysylphosphatidylglycerol synthase transmembrane domain-containing protein [Actinomycetota bacterium]|nr:lysylphosphatidylglycerol synthase transmembrane domain-containing protein [Actinomycetota bacterium]
MKLFAGLLVGGAAIWLVISTAGGLGDAVSAVGRMRVGFVALAVGFATIRIALFGLQFLWLGRRSGPLTGGAAMSLALVVYGFGAITPAAPAEGLAIASHELQQRGRSKREARMICGFSEWFSQRTFYGIAALDLIIVVALGHLPFSDSWPFMIVAFVVILALTGTAMAARRPGAAVHAARMLGALRISRPQPPPQVRRQAAGVWHAAAMAIVGSPRNRVRLALVSAAAVLTDAATLWATCHAAGFHVHPELVLLARTVGTVVSWVPLLPGGLGLVEAAIPTVLHRFGAPLDDALAATLVYRAAGTLLPALAGGLAIANLRTGDRHQPALSAAGGRGS